MRKHRWLLILVSVAAILTVTATAQSPESGASSASLELLDRGAPVAGSAAGSAGAPELRPESLTGDGPMPTATLANLLGTPSVTIGAIMTAAPPAPVGVFHGYFFAPGVDFPTSYHPFFVTGAYVFAGPPILGSPILGAGVAPGPFTAMAGTWAGFTGVPVPFGPFSPGMIFGARGIFASPGLSVPTGLGVACGFDPGVAGAVLGGLTPGTGGGKPLSAFVPPGPASGLGPIPAVPATYVAGCFITGATVPVELQTFTVD